MGSGASPGSRRGGAARAPSALTLVATETGSGADTAHSAGGAAARLSAPRTAEVACVPRPVTADLGVEGRRGPGPRRSAETADRRLRVLPRKSVSVWTPRCFPLSVPRFEVARWVPPPQTPVTWQRLPVPGPRRLPGGAVFTRDVHWLSWGLSRERPNTRVCSALSPDSHHRGARFVCRLLCPVCPAWTMSRADAASRPVCAATSYTGGGLCANSL